MAKNRPRQQKQPAKQKNQHGFTIIELLIATSVFSVVLLLVTTGIIRIGQSYYKGIIQAKTQETTRSVADEISGTIQFTSGDKTGISGSDTFCIGTVRYTPHFNQQVNPEPEGGGAPVEGLISERIEPNSCNNLAAGTQRKELLGKNMRLLDFDVQKNTAVDPSGKVWRIKIKIAYGDDDLLSHYNERGEPVGWSSDPKNDVVRGANCKSAIPGGSFCATSELDIQVKKRLN